MWKKNRIMFSPDEPTGSPVEEREPYVDPGMEADLADLLSDDPTAVIEDEPVVIDEPVIDEPVVEPDVVDPVVEPPVVEPVVVDPVVEPVELSEADELRATIARLTSELDKTAGPKSQPKVEETSVADPIQVKSPPVADPTVLDLLDMYKDKDLTEVMDTKEGFLQFMGEILNAQAQITRASIIKEIPNVVSPVVNSYSDQRSIAEKFYSDNPHLSKIKNYVSNVAVDVQAQHPDKTLSEILDLTAQAVNEVIGFKPAPTGGVEEVNSNERKKPVLPGATGGVRHKPAPTNTLADEISDLISD